MTGRRMAISHDLYVRWKLLTPVRGSLFLAGNTIT